MIKSFFDKEGIAYNEEVSLKKYNTYRLDVKCKYLVFPKNTTELVNLLKFIKENNLKHIILGNGSNIILAMDYYDGIVIKLDKLCDVTYNDKLVTVGAGYSLIKISLETMKKGLAGLDFAFGIPGAVGASTAMNAGAYNQDMASVVKEVQVLTPDLNIITMNNSELEFAYRTSFLKKHPGYLVLSTTFELTQGNPEEMELHTKERREKRMSTQPLNMPSAGSVFRNPEGMYAGELIEKSNLKGYKIGGAQVSTKHANFIVNSGNATGKEIVELISKIKKEVKRNYNVDLVLEQIIIE